MTKQSPEGLEPATEVLIEPDTLTDLIKKAICRLFGHRFRTFADGFKRRCSRCHREDWVFLKPLPRIGEPKYFWKHMDWDREYRTLLTEVKPKSQTPIRKEKKP